MGNNVIFVNGIRIEIEGNCSDIKVEGNSIFVGNKRVASDLSGIVKVKWEGPLASLAADGSVECGDVDGSILAGGSIDCGDVNGNVSAGGSISCGEVDGSVHAGGSVNMRRD